MASGWGDEEDIVYVTSYDDSCEKEARQPEHEANAAFDPSA